MSDSLKSNNQDSSIKEKDDSFLSELPFTKKQLLTFLGVVADMLAIYQWIQSGSVLIGGIAIGISIMVALFVILSYIENHRKQNLTSYSIFPEELEQLPQKKTEFLEPIVGNPIENKKLDESLKQIISPQTESDIKIIFRDNTEFIIDSLMDEYHETYRLLRVFIDNTGYGEIIDNVGIKLSIIKSKDSGKHFFSYTTNSKYDTKVKELTWKHSIRNPYTNVAMQSNIDKQKVILCLFSQIQEMRDISELEFDIVVTRNGRFNYSKRFALFLDDDTRLQLKEVQG